MPWDERWERRANKIVSGQSISFVARAKDGSEADVFIKTLHPNRAKDRKARDRFHREVLAYETLEGLGPPLLIDHNASLWRDRQVPLYMALEYIQGEDLKKVVESQGPLAVEDALGCIRELADTLQRCHEHGLLHRDIKPANIVLRGGNPSKPVLIDFGLSFNDAGEDDLTHVGEEVGNRFLRLPEHTFCVRSPTSDVTQLAGVFVYLLTGSEPRVLTDHSGSKPHQRATTRQALEQHFGGRRLLRVLSVLDTAFNTELAARYRTPKDLLDALEKAVEGDAGPTDSDIESLLAEVDEIALTEEQAILARRRESIESILQSIYRDFQSFARQRHMECRWHGYETPHPPDHVRGDARMVRDRNGNQPAYVAFRVEHRSPADYVVFQDGVEVWRGQAPDESLPSTVLRAAAANFLAR